MKQKSGPRKPPAEQVLKDIRRQTRRQYSAEEKIRIVLEGLRGEENIFELCRREGIAASMYYGWSKEFLEAGKRRLAGDTARAATSGEVKDLRRETAALKEVVADLTLENRLLKKSMNEGMGRTKREVSCVRKGRDHPAGRAIPSAGQAHGGQARHPARHVLSLVSPLPRGWRRSLGRSSITAGSGVESHPGRSARPDRRSGIGTAGAVAAGAGGALHR
jgi:transposase